MNNLVYLAGPITGTSYQGSTDWRQYAIKALEPLIGVSPMRGKDYLSQETTISDSYEESVMSCSRGIMTRDFFDCNRAAALLVNLLGSTERVSIGTCMEIAWAYQSRIPVIVCIEEKGNPHDHAMIREAIGFRTSNLADAIRVAKMIVTPKVI